MKRVIGLVLAMALATPAATEPWGRHGYGRGGSVIIVDPGYPYGPYPYPYPYPAPYPVPYPVPYPGPEPYPPSQGGRPPAPVGDDAAQRYPAWFYCDQAAAYFPYVQSCPAPWRASPVGPPPPNTPPPPPAATVTMMARCAAPDGYYPTVTTCPGGWTQEPQTRPAGAAPGPVARWYYCDDQKGFAPYVQACPKGWREIAAPPPPPQPQPPPLAPTPR